MVVAERGWALPTWASLHRATNRRTFIERVASAGKRSDNVKNMVYGLGKCGTNFLAPDWRGSVMF